MNSKIFLCVILAFIAISIYSFGVSDTEHTIIIPEPTQQPKVRLYVLDGGTLSNINTLRYGLKNDEVAFSDLAVPVFLIVHPKGTQIWETGTFPDTAWTFTGFPFLYKLKLLNPPREITITLIKPIKLQLAEIGYSTADITYLALSHYHYDHTANANEFSNATWLVRQNERDSI